MRIAILTSQLYQELSEVHGRDRVIYGGAERLLFELCHLLQSQGIEVAVYQSLPQHTTIEGKRVKVKCGQIAREFKGIPIICLPDTDEAWQYSTNPQLNMVFNEIAGFYDLSIYFASFLAWPDVIHPSISISHGIFWDYSQGSLNTYTDEQRKEFFKRQMKGFTLPDICVAVDSNVRKTMQAIEPGVEKNIQVIYNFVDTEKYVPKEKDWEGIRVLYPRRLTMLRGSNDFIRATRDYPQYEYIAVGQATNEKMEKQAEAWGKTTPHVKFIHKEMDGMEEVYQQADIAVIPTKASEGLSLSLLEAMSCGLPVITTPVGGLGDAVIDGYNALIYDPNHEKLGDYIHIMAQNPDMMRIFGERNREIAKQFDLKVWQAKWMQLINQF